ncbi:hypothetical protein N4G70_25755 [Streptomyces sp. ASQP_92]|uniref:hypothetical protein n=1 Tax=Streptomyces sp. ASQP_92 TaxID=2979116 RepID=UPI0021BE0EB1|nr:hypothetical protein [Streptomyces sp. ASQP_92]MCT9092251.1 hypothetical protein [Streptomyces sp. ASQP_92]
MTAPEDRTPSEKRATQQGREALVGVRPRGDVDLALKYLTTRSDASAQLALGVAAAYRWALGLAAQAPVTGSSARHTPDLRLLTAEVDAAVVQLEDPTTQPGARDFTRGVHEALAWVCGYSDTRI